MKKELFIGSILCLIVMAFFIYEVIEFGNRNSSLTPLVKSYSLAEVQKHNTATDCWQAFYGGVYDLTEYIDQHPGGKNMIKYCGQEATAVFESIKKGQGHSQEAKTIMKDYYLGTLK